MKKDEGTENREKRLILEMESSHFAQISHNITKNKKLSDFAVRLYGYLKSHNETFIISKRKIATYYNKGESTIQRALNELKKAGFLEVKKINKNEYKYILYNSPKNKEYAIIQEINTNGLNNLISNIKDIYNILNNKEITKDTKQLINDKLQKILNKRWLDDDE